MVKKASIIIVGFGSVGRNLAKLIAFRNKIIEDKYDTRINVSAILDSRGAVVKEEGFTPYELLKLCELPRSSVSSYKPYGFPSAKLKDVYSKIIPDVQVEVTPSNYENGEPGLSDILYALKNKVNIVSSNKAPFVLAYKRLMDMASKNNVQIRFKATVMAGTPLIDLLNGLKGYDIESVEGILNGTTNFILTEMHENLLSYSEALKKAQALGIAEANPDLDVKGWDPAAKLVIISNVIGQPIELSRVDRDDLSRLDIKEIYKAIKENKVIKFIASLNIKEKKASVKLTKIPREDILASVNGTLNAVKIRTDVNNITLIGKGAGGAETAHAILDDLIGIIKVI